MAKLLTSFGTVERTREDLYDVLYGSRNLQEPIKSRAYDNLDLQIGYLIKNDFVVKEGEVFKAVKSEI